MRHKHMDLACRAAENAAGPFKHGCVVAKGRKVLSVSTNDPLMHAETRALSKVPKRELSRGGLTIYVARYSVGCGGTCMSKPCIKCQKAIVHMMPRGSVVYHTI